MIRPIAACLALPLVISALAGCALFESREMRALRQSPDYRAGYSDGCATASAAGATGAAGAAVRDDTAFRANRAYSMGWSAGRSMCRSTFSSPPGAGTTP